MATRRTADGPGFALLTFVVASIAAIGASIFVAVLAVVPAYATGQTSPEQVTAAAFSYWAMVATIIFSQLAMAGVALAAWKLTGAPFRERLGFTRPRTGTRDSVVVLLAGGVPFVLAIGFASLMPSLTPPDAVFALWGECTLPQAVLWVAAIGLLPGTIEEVLYRGLIQRGFMRRFSPILSIVITSSLFALMHIDPPAMALALTLGLWLGFVAWRTGSIVLTVLTHILINSGWNIAMIVAAQTDVSDRTQSAAIIGLGVISLPAFVWSLRILARAGRPPTLSA
jgi:membrane protease YdiL (CAAX protease family)